MEGANDFEAELNIIDLNGSTATALQQQANDYSELAKQFPAFKPYEQMIVSRLDRDRDQICRGILQEGDIDQDYASLQINIEGELKSLQEIGCSLFENGHTLVSFGGNSADTRYTLSIETNSDADKDLKEFTVSSDKEIADALVVVEPDDISADDQDLRQVDILDRLVRAAPLVCLTMKVFENVIL